MAKTVQDVMTRNPVTVDVDSTAAEAARLMKDHDIGSVLVCKEERLCGIVTDRDLAIRCVADGNSTDEPLREICSTGVFTLSPDDEIAAAVDAMKERAIRRIAVVDDDEHVVGVVSLGDLALAQDPGSALGRISAAPPNQ